MVNGERINDAIGKTITGRVEVGPGVVRSQVWFKDCVFKERFTANRAMFGESLLFEDVVFEQGINLDGCSIQGDFFAFGVICKEEATFERLTVQGRCSLDAKCKFEPRINFTLATFKSYTDFAGKFLQGADILQADFNNSLILAIDCTGDFNLTFASIRGQLLVEKEAILRGKLDLGQASISGLVQVEMDGFASSASLHLNDARLASNLTLSGGELSKPDGTCINLEGIEIGGDLSISGLTLGAPQKSGGETLPALTMAEAAIKGNVTLSRLRSEGSVSFFRTSVAGWFRFDKQSDSGRACKFDKDVNFSSAHLGDLSCIDSDFGGKANFSDMSILETTDISGCEFMVDANFNRARFGGRLGCQATFHGPALFESAKFSGPVRFLSTDNRQTRCVFHDTADFYFGDFEHEVNFGGATLRKSLDLRFARFSRALLFEWKSLEDDVPADQTQFADRTDGNVKVLLRECRYEALVLPEEFSHLETGRPLLEFIERFPVNDSPAHDGARDRSDDLPPLLYLERYLRKQGRVTLANMIRRARYKAQRQRSRKLGERIWIWFYRASNYGTNILAPLAATVILGIMGATHREWLRVVPYHDQDWERELGKAAFVACLALVAGIFTDALRQRLNSDLS